MSTVPPLLPELGLDGSRPVAAPVGEPATTIRLGARVVAVVGADTLIETVHGRRLLQGGPPLRPGATLSLELQHADPALARAGHLLGVGQQSMDPPLPVRLQPVPPTTPAATVRSATALEVSVRVVGPDNRPTTAAFPARLVVPVPEPGPAAPGSRLSMASGGAVPRGSAQPRVSGPAGIALPASTPVAPGTGAPPTGPNPATSIARADPSTIRSAIPEPVGVLTTQSRPIEAMVLPRDALGRVLLRAAGLTFRIDSPLDLPAGARLQLILPVDPARSSAAPLQAGPLEAVRTLGAWLRDQAGMAQASHAAMLRLPEPDASLAARLLRLVQLIAPRPGDPSVRRPAEPAPLEGPGPARIRSALAELCRLAGEPQSGGWRVLLLPLGFAGTPLLRLYIREDPGAEDGGDRRQRDRAPVARRALFELEFGELGRCQMDVLCQARRFDLLLRTGQPLPAQARREIREIYMAARDGAGILGELRFQVGHWATLPEPAGAGGRGGGITV